MKIGGTLVSSIELSGKMSLVIFMAGCPFRCPYCHNHEIISGGTDVTLEEIFEMIYDSSDYIDAVVISGGEPLVQVNDLKEILSYVKQLQLETKVDTSGYYFQRLKEVIPLIDYLSLDIKAPFNKYKKVTMEDIGKDVKKSMEIANNSKNTHVECRTTYVPALLSKEDIKQIAIEITCDEYTIQQFRNKNVLDKTLEKTEAPNPYELREIAKEIKPLLKKVNIKTAEFGEETI